jgi:hypothetical protein
MSQEVIKTVSRPEKWWRSDSPRSESLEQVTIATQEREQRTTHGVFYFGKRNQQTTQYRIGSGSNHAFTNKDATGNDPPPSISGYSGFIPGKYAGNVIGGTYNQCNYLADIHLRSTCQARVNPDGSKLS